VTPAASREPRSVPPGRALLWFGEAIRLWKRGPLPFSLMALVVIVIFVAIGPVPVVGLIVANVLVPLLMCGLLFASLAADRNERPQFRHLFMGFVAPASAQLAVVASAVAVTLIESALAWSIAGVNMLAPDGGMTELPASTIMMLYATDVLVSLPFTFVAMAALFDGERPARAFSSSLRAFARNPRAMLTLGVYTFTLLLAGLATTGIGLVLGLPWIAAAQYAAWKDIYGVEGSARRAPGEVA
jgi:hypothetical protein